MGRLWYRTLAVVLLAACAVWGIRYVLYLRQPYALGRPSLPDVTSVAIYGPREVTAGRGVWLDRSEEVAAFKALTFAGAPQPDPSGDMLWKIAGWDFFLFGRNGGELGRVAYYDGPYGGMRLSHSPTAKVRERLKLLWLDKPFVQLVGERRVFETTPEWTQWLREKRANPRAVSVPMLVPQGASGETVLRTARRLGIRAKRVLWADSERRWMVGFMVTGSASLADDVDASRRLARSRAEEAMGKDTAALSAMGAYPQIGATRYAASVNRGRSVATRYAVAFLGYVDRQEEERLVRIEVEQGVAGLCCLAKVDAKHGDVVFDGAPTDDEAMALVWALWNPQGPGVPVRDRSESARSTRQ